MYKNNLYYIRISRGQTQKEFSKELGMNPNVYSRYERGETNMSLEVAKNIAFICDVSLDYLAGIEEPDYADVAEGQAILEEHEMEEQINEHEESMREKAEQEERIREIVREEIERSKQEP